MKPSTHDAPTGSISLSEREYEAVRQLVYEHSRINLGPNKRELVTARLSKRLRSLHFNSFKDYLALLDSAEGKEEFSQLIDAISTNHTFFFRETGHFEFLEKKILPAHNPRETLRIWSAACSSGEEPYSIAILLHDYFSRQKAGSCHIECSDISTKVLRLASDGIFAHERIANMRRDWLVRYFQKGRNQWAGHYRVKDSLRASLNFQRLNLMSPSFPFREPFQIIFCRNVMIYFDKPTQEDLVERLTRQLAPGGFLFIGHAESLTGIRHSLKMIEPAIYKKL